MYKTCKHIEESLYVAPNEVRACCQRFFYEGKMRGDAKLLEIKDGVTPTADDLKKGRQKLFNEVQEDKNEDCKGCPFLKKTNVKPLISHYIKHLSIEHHSVCNLRCNYCSETYYGGKRSKYNVVEFIKYLNDSGSFENTRQVVWGGGEPTLDKSFDKILEEINKNANPKLFHRVFTNSVRYSEAIEKFLKIGLIKITTSVDAGTPEVFKVVRGRPKFLNVFENLNKYASIDSKKITIKYIFTDENNSEKELKGFVDNCLKYNLENCNFQLSMNYKKENLDIDNLKKIVFLFSVLNQNGVKKIFVDDHISLRLISLSTEEINQIISYINQQNLKNIILDPESVKDLIVYGAGEIAKEIIKKTLFFKNVKNFDIVDNDPKKIGSKIFNKEIFSKELLKNDNRKVFITSAQFYGEIYDNIEKIQGSNKSIISGLIL